VADAVPRIEEIAKQNTVPFPSGQLVPYCGTFVQTAWLRGLTANFNIGNLKQYQEHHGNLSLWKLVVMETCRIKLVFSTPRIKIPLDVQLSVTCTYRDISFLFGTFSAKLACLENLKRSLISLARRLPHSSPKFGKFRRHVLAF
jgi:hypothetical protein